MKLAPLLLLPFLAGDVSAAFPTLHLQPVCDDQLHAPTELTHAGDGSGRLFICDQPGQIRIFQHGMLLPDPFLDLSAEFEHPDPDTPGLIGTGYTERGLLGLAFHPGFADPMSPGHRRFYVNYTTLASHPTLNPVGAGGGTDCVTVIAEFQASADNPNQADPSSKRVVLTYGQPQSNHNGGQLAFGPDGLLYIGSGDGGGSHDNQLGHTEGTSSRPAAPNQRLTGSLGNGQDRRSLLGKILRIDPLGSNGPGGSYGIPAGNPFIGLTQDLPGTALDGPMRGEIFAYGLRNPWKFSFDASFGGAARLICADVGQGDVEELDFITAGGNFGWRMREGSVDFDLPTVYQPEPAGVGAPSVIAPFTQYAHPNATLPGTQALPKLGTSITGGYVYRGTAIPALQGKYLCADYAANGIGGGGGVLIGVEQTSPGVFSTPAVVPLFQPLPSQARIYAFGQDESGEMYVAVKTTSGVLALDNGLPAGTIYRLAPAETSLNLTADRDNTLYETGTSTGDLRSNGKGPYVYAGKTGESAEFKLRRTLVHFDLSSVPPGVTLTQASLSLRLSLQVAQDYAMKVHKVSAAWGEGDSNAGNPGGAGTSPAPNDATWHHRFYSTTSPVLWTNPGGDFAATASATRNVGNALSEPVQTWTGSSLLADVQAWLADPTGNHGWILLGEEVEPYSAQRFASREATAAQDRPKLSLTYLAAPAPTRREAWLTEHYPDEPVGFYLDPAADEDGDGLATEFEYALDLDPHAVNNVDLLSIEVRPGYEGGTDHVFHFQRNAGTSDLDLLLEFRQAAGDWQVLARSLAGAAMMGENGAEVVADESVNGDQYTVSVRLNAPDENPLERGFGRLRLERRAQ